MGKFYKIVGSLGILGILGTGAWFVGKSWDSTPDLPESTKELVKFYEPPNTPEKKSFVCPTYDVDCPELTYAEAQRIYNSCGPGDRYRLDRDKDGIACDNN